MAIEIKSNIAVIDTEGKFPYVTALGNTYHQELYNYVNNENVVIATTEFSALDSLITSLKSLNVWNGITEFFPLMGNTINSQMVKLKSASNTVAEKFNSLSDSFTDGKGLYYATQVSTSAKALKLGVTNQNLYASNTGFGIISYFKNNTDSTVNTLRSLFGQSTALGGLSAGDFGMQISDDTKVIFDRQFNSTPTLATYTSEIQLYVSKIVWNASKQISKRLFRSNGTQLLNSISTVNITAPTHTDFLLLGAQKVKDSATNGGYGWVGNIRLFIMHDGTMDEAKIPQVETIINQFISASGKTL